MTDEPIGVRAPRPGETRRRLWRVVAVVLIYGVLGGNAVWMLRKPVVGVADNGDFWRVMRPAGIEPREGHRMDGRFVDPLFEVGPADLSEGTSAPASLAWLAKRLGSRSGVLDLRWMGGVYLVLLAFVVSVALARGASPLFVLALTLIFCDVAYLPFFNSFYADPALFVALLGTTFWFAGRGSRGGPTERGPGRVGWLAAGCLLSVCLLGGFSKAQYSVFPAVVAAALLTTWVAGRRPRGPRFWVMMAAMVAIAVAAPLWFVAGPGPNFPEVNRYHGVYAGLLVLASDPDESLAQLGVPAELRELPRADVFSAKIGADHPVHRVLADVSLADLAVAYLRDPAAIVRGVGLATNELSAPKSHRRGTREKGFGQYAYAWRRTDLSRWRAEIATRATWLPVALVVTGLALFGFEAWTRRGSGLGDAMLFLAAWVTCQIAVVLLGDGTVSLRQHLLGARLGTDLLAVTSMFWGGSFVR